MVNIISTEGTSEVLIRTDEGEDIYNKQDSKDEKYMFLDGKFISPQMIKCLVNCLTDDEYTLV